MTIPFLTWPCSHCQPSRHLPSAPAVSTSTGEWAKGVLAQFFSPPWTRRIWKSICHMQWLNNSKHWSQQVSGSQNERMVATRCSSRCSRGRLWWPGCEQSDQGVLLATHSCRHHQPVLRGRPCPVAAWAVLHPLLFQGSSIAIQGGTRLPLFQTLWTRQLIALVVACTVLRAPGGFFPWQRQAASQQVPIDSTAVVAFRKSWGCKVRICSCPSSYMPVWIRGLYAQLLYMFCWVLQLNNCSIIGLTK